MASIDDIINHPNFGNLFNGGHGFRNAFTSRLSRESSISEVFPTMKMGFENGQFNIRFQNDDRAIPKLTSETNAQYFERARAQYQQGFTSYRQYLGNNPFGSSRTGSYFSNTLQLVGDLYGLDIEVGTLGMETPNVADHISNLIGGNKGFAVPDSETPKLLRMRRKGTQNYLSMDAIKEVFGINPDESMPFKRMNMLTNETPLSVAYKASERQVGVAVLSHDQMYAHQGFIKEQIRNEARRTGLPVSEVSKDVYKKASDGTLQISRSAFNRQVDFARKGVQDMKAQLKSLPVGSPEYLQMKNQISKTEDFLTEVIVKSKKGLSFNTRIFNGVDRITQTSFDMAKGEAILIEDSDFLKRIKGIYGMTMSDKDILGSVDFLTTAENINNDFKIADNRALGRISVATLVPDKLPGPARSNTLTTATFGSLLNVDDYLVKNLQKSIREDVNAIKNGDVKGIRKILKTLSDIPEHGISDADRAQMVKTREFATRIKEFIDSGGDLTKDPFLTEQFLTQVKQHYFTPSMSTDPITGEVTQDVYKLSSRSVDALNGRFPQGGVLAHLGSSLALGMDQDHNIPGVIRVNHGEGRLGISALDARRTYRSFGGFDFDDSIGLTYQYDNKTKRLLGLALRDPNAMGEYFIFDVDIEFDSNMPDHIRSLYREHKDLNKKLSNKTSEKISEKRARQLLGRLNEVKSDLDKYFSGKTVIDPKTGKALSQTFISDIDLVDRTSRGLPAPAGFRRKASNYLQENSYLSMKVVDTSDVIKSVGDIRSQNRALFKNSKNFSLYESDLGYNESERYFKMMPTTKAPKSTEKLSAKFIQEKLRQAQANHTVLGSTVNQYTVIDNFLSTHLDFMGDSNVPAPIKRELEKLLQKYPLERIGREALIDAIVKESNTAIQEMASKGLVTNMENFGSIIRELNDFAAANGFNDFRAGIDPIVAAQRLNGSSSEAVAKGFGSKDGFILSDLDPKATHARLMLMQSDMIGEMDNLTQDTINLSRSKLQAVIGNETFTPDQQVFAQSIIEEYQQEKAIMRNADMGKHIDRLMGLEPPDPSDAAAVLRYEAEIDRYTDSSLQAKMITRLEGKTSSDLRAIASVLMSNESGLGLINGAATEDQTLKNIFSGALFERDMFREIDGIIDRPSDLFKFVEKRDGTYSFTTRANQVMDVKERNRRLTDALHDVYYRSNVGWKDVHYSEVEEILGMIASSPERNRVVEPTAQIGAKANALRALSDDEAEGVLSGDHLKSLIRRFDGPEARRLLESKAARSGLVAMAAFAGYGVIHRLVTGDRTEDQMNPYPLIPQGSEYESILNDNGVEFNPSMTGNGGMTYTIRTQNYSDTESLSRNVRGVLPNGGTTIYNSQSPSYNNYGLNSRDILSGR